MDMKAILQDMEGRKKNEDSSIEINHNSYKLRSSYSGTDSGYDSISHCSDSKLSFLSTKKCHRFQFRPYQTRRKSTNRSRINSSESFAEGLKNTSRCQTVDFSDTELCLDYSKAEKRQNSFQMKLRSHHRKPKTSPNSQSQSSSHHTVYDILSPLPIPLLSSSPFTIKPADHQMKLKFIIPQSTPCILNSSTSSTPLHNITFSPISCKNSPCVSFINSKKFSHLSISDTNLIHKNNKTKKVDLNKSANFINFHQKQSLDHTGKETVDVLKLLGEKSNHPKIVSKILSYLSCQDLCAVDMVSKSWQRICRNDAKAEERRLKYIVLKQCSKENLISFNKSKLEEIQLSPKARYPRRGFFTAVPTNLLQAPKLHLTPNSPPVSPSKVIFHSFVKAGRSLAPRDQLAPCPLCKFACRIEYEKNIGTCSRQSCPMEEFCILCSSKVHAGEPCKMPLLATPTKRSKHYQPIAGTKQCKRNLRRISRLT